jgi:hypothetical protein
MGTMRATFEITVDYDENDINDNELRDALDALLGTPAFEKGVGRMIEDTHGGFFLSALSDYTNSRALVVGGDPADEYRIVAPFGTVYVGVNGLSAVLKGADIEDLYFDGQSAKFRNAEVVTYRDGEDLTGLRILGRLNLRGHVSGGPVVDPGAGALPDEVPPEP